MKYLKLKADVTYKLHRFKDSQWVKVTHNKVMIGLCFDISAAYQVVFTHIVDNGGQCEKLDRNDFKY